jgi:Flp pilus assembly protein TadG
MMKQRRHILANVRGASAIEFALVAPVFILILVGIAQLGILFFANAGLNNALAEGARLATLYPRPTATQIKAKINAADFGLNPASLATPQLVYGTNGSSNYYDMSMQYTTQLNFVFYKAMPITLKQSRRVYLQPLPPT